MNKYKIQECLDRLTVKELKIVTKELPKLLGITENTIMNYRKIKADDKPDIPYITVRKLESFFKLKPGEMLNIPLKTKTYEQVIQEHKS